jgi:hypothetical protein
LPPACSTFCTAVASASSFASTSQLAGAFAAADGSGASTHATVSNHWSSSGRRSIATFFSPVAASTEITPRPGSIQCRCFSKP